MSVGELYTRFRLSYMFFWLLVLVDIIWLSWNWLLPWPIDDDIHSHLNLFISIETQLSLAVVGIENFRQQRSDRREQQRSDEELARDVKRVLRKMDEIGDEIDEP